MKFRTTCSIKAEPRHFNSTQCHCSRHQQLHPMWFVATAFPKSTLRIFLYRPLWRVYCNRPLTLVVCVIYLDTRLLRGWFGIKHTSVDFKSVPPSLRPDNNVCSHESPSRSLVVNYSRVSLRGLVKATLRGSRETLGSLHESEKVLSLAFEGRGATDFGWNPAEVTFLDMCWPGFARGCLERSGLPFSTAVMGLEVDCWEALKVSLGGAGWASKEVFWADLVSPVLEQ